MDDPKGPEPDDERGVEGEEERFYTRSDPRGTVSLPPDPGTTPAELEETDAAGLAPEPDPAAGAPRSRRP
ncbi:MAG TPA: hypothetical protein VFI63_01160 [Solirubrobacterales bacterium]|nr:hypothetical protein [Solirubrobacterales bacterium]